MARRKRFFLGGQPLHVIQRGNNRQAVFFAETDYAQYIGWLAEAAREYGLAIHGYVLMTNHVHLLAAPADADSLSRTMQSLGRRYVRYVNGRHGRCGKGASAPRRSTPTPIFSIAADISNSIRCGRGWSHASATGAGRAIAPTRSARPIPW
ncbi:MAG TPA: transposase [Rhizomicrobium sp.]|nr:transposase [Rhizomicrobium sp.]